ncbi:hypothetical protein OSI18_23605, partial [Mycobacterium ulcerans]
VGWRRWRLSAATRGARATVTTGPPASPRSAANGATQPARATEAHQRTPAAPTKASGVHTPSTRRHAKPA